MKFLEAILMERTGELRLDLLVELLLEIQALVAKDASIHVQRGRVSFMDAEHLLPDGLPSHALTTSEGHTFHTRSTRIPIKEKSVSVVVHVDGPGPVGVVLPRSEVARGK